jgi:hypothetical protein
MKHTLPYKMVDGHIIVTSGDGKICLIDTGAPCSVGNAEIVMFAGGRYPLQSTFLGRAADDLPGPIGVRIDVLMGVDILNRYDMLIDPVRQVLVFSDEELDVEGEVLPIEQAMGVPIVTADVDGRRMKMFFDTGAKVSYVNEETAKAYPQVGTAQDFYVTVGPFQTAIHRIPMLLGSLTIDLECGTLPQSLQLSLAAAGAAGIVGNEILVNFMVAYMPRRKRIILMKRRQEVE